MVGTLDCFAPAVPRKIRYGAVLRIAYLPD